MERVLSFVERLWRKSQDEQDPSKVQALTLGFSKLDPHVAVKEGAPDAAK